MLSVFKPTPPLLTPVLYKLIAVFTVTLLFFTPAFADVSYAGLYIAVAFVLLTLLLPVIIVVLTKGTRKKQYLTILVLWAGIVFAYLWFGGGSETEFYLASSLSYILLVVYLFKERRLSQG